MSVNRGKAARRLSLSLWLVLCFGLCGLCTAAPANTTAASAAQAAPVILAQASPSQLPGDPPLSPPSVAADAAPRGRLRVALLLPLRSTSLKPFAEMVRDGVLAAHERDGANIDLSSIDTDDSVPNIVAAYRDAVTRFDVIIGPLSRSAVAAVAASGFVSRPTIALAQPDAPPGTQLTLPPRLVVIGLSVEEEARQAAGWAGREHAGGKALVVSTGVAWQKRAARAFISQWQANGAPVDVMELSGTGTLDGAALAQLRKRFQADPPALVFAALDAAQTRQVRTAIERDTPLYGTSQINALTLQELPGAQRQPALDGVRLLDLPWQLQPDHPAVMIYPHPLVVGQQRRGPDFERLYALGIDAFRIATEIGAGQTRLSIDGVTGTLTLQFDGSNPAVFERIERQASYVDGRLQPLAVER